MRWIRRWGKSRLACVGLLAAAGVTTACSGLDSPADTCRRHPDCTPTVAETPWGCLAEGFQPDNSPPMGLGFVLSVVDFNNPNPSATLPGLEVGVCQIRDENCSQNLAGEGGGVAVQAVEGEPAAFQMGLPFGFEGFLRMTATGYLNTEYYFADELSMNLEGGDPPVVVGETITLPRGDRIQDFFDSVASTQDEAAGILALRTFDCLGARASGVQVVLENPSGDEIPWVFSGGIPLQGLLTDDQGVGGFANVPEGPVTLMGINPDDEVYGTVTIRAQPNTLTFAEIRPARPLARSD